MTTSGIAAAARAWVALMLPAPISPTWIVKARSGGRFLEQRLHAGKALTARFLRRAATAPMRLERAGVAVAVALQRAELARPVDDAAAHRHPLPLAAGAARRVLAVDVADAILGHRGVAARERHLVAELRVARIPGELQRLLGNRVQQPRRFRTGGGVARVLVLEHQRQAAGSGLHGRGADHVVDRFSVRRLIVEPPEVEDPDAIGVERFRELERALEQLGLLRVGEAGTELVALRAEARFRRVGPVDLEDRRGDARDAQLEALEDLARVGNPGGVPVHDVLAAGLAQIDQPEPEFARRHLAGVA